MPFPVLGTPGHFFFPLLVGLVFSLEFGRIPSVCTSPDLPSTTRTYYVAKNQPGSSNDLCDGLSPTDLGAGHCPFHDFASFSVRELLIMDGPTYGTKDVSVFVREGTYDLEPMNFPTEPEFGLMIESSSSSADEPIVFSSYNNEEVILSGLCTFNASRVNVSACRPPGRMGIILQSNGKHVFINGFTFDHGHQWSILVTGSETRIQCNLFLGPYNRDSDCIKAANDDPGVYVFHNEFSDGPDGSYQQAIDIARPMGWVVENNSFHGGEKGVGCKYGGYLNIVRRNHFYDLRDEAISLGGGSSPHTNEYEAYNLVAEENLIENCGWAVQFVHSFNCTFRNNDVRSTTIGVNGIRVTEHQSTGCPNVTWCSPATLEHITGNRFLNITPIPVSGFSNIFYVLYEAFNDLTTLDADNNVFCVHGGDLTGEFFGISDATQYDFDSWKSYSGQDHESMLVHDSELICAEEWLLRFRDEDSTAPGIDIAVIVGAVVGSICGIVSLLLGVAGMIAVALCFQKAKRERKTSTELVNL